MRLSRAFLRSKDVHCTIERFVYIVDKKYCFLFRDMSNNVIHIKSGINLEIEEVILL